MPLKIRNAANTAWLDIPVSKVTKVRNAANSAWITATGANFKIRNAANTGWITSALSIPTVTTTSGFTSIMDVSSNGNHQTLTDGTAYGLWLDGPVLPYKGSDGVVRFTVPSSENFMFMVPDWNVGAGWVLSYVYDSPRQSPESHYNNRHWLFGKYALSDGTVYCLAHHEWYQTMKTVDGHAGFNGYALFNRRWVNAVKWMKSTDNGASWSQKGALNSSDLVVIPEPWATQSRDTVYGFFHPTNIVKEGSYYYCFVDHRSLPGGTNLLDSGSILIRTDDLEKSAGWEYWTGSSWFTMSAASYLGNLSPQPQPMMHFKVTGNNPYAVDPGNVAIFQCIRYHVPSGMWMAFGSSSTLATGNFCYTVSETLAAPQFEANGVRSVSLAGGGVVGDYATYGGRYVSVFDPAATDRNFERIEGSTAIVFVSEDYVRYRKQTISIS